MSLTIVTFHISPYVMRVVAAMHYKNLEFEVKYVDLDNKPDWFIKASPLEKVPLLIKGDQFLFESNVILDYIDITSPPSLQPQDPFEKSLARARMEFSSEVLGTARQFMKSKTEAGYNETVVNIQWYFGKIEGWLQNSQFLGGNEITLVDFAFAPIFTILVALKPILKYDVFEGFPRLKEYAETLTSLPAVQKAKVPDYDKLVIERAKFYGAWIVQ